MIKEVIENIDYLQNNNWYKGHLYITDNNEVIWSPSTIPLHQCEPKPDYKSSIRSILITGSIIDKPPARQKIDFSRLLAIRRIEKSHMRKKGFAILLIQTISDDIAIKGKIKDINKISEFLPQSKDIKESINSIPIYFYKDSEVIKQLFEQTPEGDIIEIIREANVKIGAKGVSELGNDLVAKLSIELSTELSETSIIKSQITDTKKIAIILLFLIAYGNAQDITKFDLRKVPEYLYFDKNFIFNWTLNDDTKGIYELSSKIGPINTKLDINKKNIVHDTIFDQLKQQKQIRLQGLVKSSNELDGSINLVPVFLAN